MYQNVASKLWLGFNFCFYTVIEGEGETLSVIIQLQLIYEQLACATEMHDLRFFIGTIDSGSEII